MLLSRYKISGHSMAPYLVDSENVVVSSMPYFFTKPKIGDVVAFEIKGKIYIKRIKEIAGENYYLVGDNKKDSYDSRRFGFVKKNKIKGKVIGKFK